MVAPALRRRIVRVATGLSGLLVVVVVVVPQVAQAQLGQVGTALPDTVGRTLGGVRDTLDPVDRALSDVRGDARALAQAQAQRVRDLVRRHPGRIEVDPQGQAVRAGELIVSDPDAAMVAAAQARGFRLIEQVALDELGIVYARFASPPDLSLRRASRLMRMLAGGREVSADPLHFASGPLAGAATRPAPAAGQTPAGDGRRIGIIDGGLPARTPGLAKQQAFATGGPRASDHAAAIASLLTGGGGIRASAGGAGLYGADVYGTDPAGGNATAIARALAWMVRERVPVVVVSLVGPPNPLLGRVVAAARQRGTVVVAAVGNDGPAAPPAYPASYAQAIAVTGVDGQGRPLIEAGRAAKLDYAAPAADMLALDAAGRARAVRGTSFAAPFVAARLSANLGSGPIEDAIAAVDREAKGGGRRLGRGIVCAACRTPPR